MSPAIEILRFAVKRTFPSRVFYRFSSIESLPRVKAEAVYDVLQFTLGLTWPVSNVVTVTLKGVSGWLDKGCTSELGRFAKCLLQKETEGAHPQLCEAVLPYMSTHEELAESAKTLLSVMIQQKYIPSTEVIAAASKSFVQDSKSLMHIVKLIQDQGMKPPLKLYNVTLDKLLQEGHTKSSEILIKRMLAAWDVVNSETYLIMMKNAKDFHHVLSIWETMKNNVTLNESIASDVVSSLLALSELGVNRWKQSVPHGKFLDLIHRVVIHDLLKSGCTLPPSLVSKLFSLYCRRAKVKNAIELFLDHCKYLKALPEEKGYTELIDAVVLNPRYADSRFVLWRATLKCCNYNPPLWAVIAYTKVLTISQDRKEFESMVQQVLRRGSHNKYITLKQYNWLIKGCSLLKAKHLAIEILRQLIRQGHMPNKDTLDELMFMIKTKEDFDWYLEVVFKEFSMVHSSITSKEALDCFLATYRRIDCYEANATKSFIRRPSTGLLNFRLTETSENVANVRHCIAKTVSSLIVHPENHRRTEEALRHVFEDYL